MYITNTTEGLELNTSDTSSSVPISLSNNSVFQFLSGCCQYKTEFNTYSHSLFCRKRVLQLSEGIDDLVGVQWELLGCLVLGWGLVYLIIWRGLHASGKVRLCAPTLTGT
jgi:hypothetical protein